MPKQTALSLCDKNGYEIEDELNEWFEKGWRILPITIKTKDKDVVVILERSEGEQS